MVPRLVALVENLYVVFGEGLDGAPDGLVVEVNIVPVVVVLVMEPEEGLLLQGLRPTRRQSVGEAARHMKAA
jgi:hypothetical protein